MDSPLGGGPLIAQLFIGLALSAQSYWWTEPVVLDLEPAGPHYIERHRQLMEARTSGPGASPTFRSAWTRMDAHWAMVSAGDAGLLISQEEAARYRELAMVAASVAGQDLLNETIDRSDVLRGMRTAVRSVTSPSLRVRKNRDDQVTIQASQSPALQRNELIAAAIGEPNCPVDGAERPHSGGATEHLAPRPQINMGFAGGASATGAADAAAGSGSGDLSFTLAWSAYIQARNLGVDVLRLSGNVLEWEPLAPAGAPSPLTTGAWTLSARERFLPRWTALADARSVSGQVALDTVRPALAWQVSRSNPRWYLQTGYAYGLVTDGRPKVETMTTLRLLWTSQWASPSAPDTWPLGARPGHTGPIWPDELDPHQNDAASLLQTPAQRYADADASEERARVMLVPALRP